MALYGYVGRGMMGKTYSLVDDAFKQYLRGELIASNTPLIDLRVKRHDRLGWVPVDALQFGLPWAAIRLNTLEDLEKIDNCKAVVDEAYSWMPNAGAGNEHLPRTTKRLIAQERKNGIDLYWSHRVYEAMHKDVRDNTLEVVSCTRRGNVITQYVYDPQDPKKAATHFKRINPFTYDLYQTLFAIGDRAGLGTGLGKRKTFDEANRRIYPLLGFGPHCDNIYVRAEQLLCLRRKFGDQVCGIYRHEKPVAAAFDGPGWPKLFHEENGPCLWQGHITYDTLSQKWGLT